ncbi:MAG: cytochrome c biogenesis protein [Phycisphaeraceae bacterium]
MPHHRLLIVLLFVTTALLAAPLSAQVPGAPDGNNLPGEGAMVDPHALEELGATDGEAAPPNDQHHHGAHGHSSMTFAEHRAFAQQINLADLRGLAVFDNGRVKILETLAQEQLKRIYGKPAWKDADTGATYDPVFTYLDIVFNRGYYHDKAIIHVEQLPLQQQLVGHLPRDEAARWTKLRKLSPHMFEAPSVARVLEGRGSDLRHYEAQQQVLGAAMAFDRTGQRLVMVSPPADQDQWAHLLELRDTRLAAAEGSDATAAALSVANPEAASAVNGAVQQLAVAWGEGDANAVNEAIGVLTEHLPRINPETYPPSWKLTLESIYNATHKFTIGYVAYLLGTITLLIAFAVGRRWITTTGAALALGGFAVHTAGMLVRGVLSGRWPIHNQFESFIAITWFAVGVGLVLMFVRRQWLFGAAAAALGTCSLLLANMVEIPSNDVGQVAGILDTSNILYIHVNIVLCSYALIALAFFIALFYLAVHHFGDKTPGAGDGGGAQGGAGMLQFAAAGLGHDATADAAPVRGRQALLHDLDRAHMIVLQLAFWLLGVGVLLGAYWADHAWGRWWGWDPKETWALITWIVYLIAIHVRFGVQKRGLATAWLSVVGFFVMLFTYWGVNLLLPGLHSYA